MKTTTKQNTVVRSGVGREQGFKIAATARAFDVLSQGIYTDIPLAVVREISTNAWDAHIEDGHRKPFDVHLPNNFEPYLSIRDYGVGLSPDDVENIYTTYFASTRNESDDFTGCLGLGSKSPFAYADQFLVISRFNGTQYTYSLFKSEGDTPTIALLGEMDTDEHNGIEVKINIDENDIYKFIDAAKRVYQFFDVRPNITGATIDFGDMEPEVEGNNYKLYSQRGNLSTINVVMGQVCYRTDSYRFQHSIGRSGAIVLFVNIGDVQMAASREELQYDDKTIEHINAAIATATYDATKQLQERISTAANTFERIQASHMYSNMLSVRVGETSIPTQKDDAYMMRGITVRRDRMKINDGYHHISPRAGATYTFIEEDVDALTQKHRARIRLYATHKDHCFLVKIEDREIYEAEFGSVTVKVTDLPDVPRKKPEDRAAPSFVKKMSRFSGNAISRQWEHHDVIPTKGAFAVRRKGNYVLWCGRTIEPSGFRDYLAALEIDPSKVYGITSRHYDRFVAEYGFIDLEACAKKRMERFAARVTSHELSCLQHGSPGGYNTVAYIGSRVIASLSPVCRDYMAASRVDAPNAYMKRLLDDFDIEVPETTNYQTAFNARYPLLTYISSFNDDTVGQYVIQYIRLIESQQEEE